MTDKMPCHAKDDVCEIKIELPVDLITALTSYVENFLLV
jgi:hypothetical protein